MARWIELFFLVAALTVLSLLVRLPIAEPITPFVHLLGGLALFLGLIRALRGRPLTATLLVVLASVLLEPAQGLLTADRSPDPVDALGGVLGALLGLLLRAWGRRHETPLT
jgi:hypothetical protein